MGVEGKHVACQSFTLALERATMTNRETLSTEIASSIAEFARLERKKQNVTEQWKTLVRKYMTEFHPNVKRDFEKAHDPETVLLARSALLSLWVSTDDTVKRQLVEFLEKREVYGKGELDESMEDPEYWIVPIQGVHNECKTWSRCTVELLKTVARALEKSMTDAGFRIKDKTVNSKGRAEPAKPDLAKPETKDVATATAEQVQELQNKLTETEAKVPAPPKQGEDFTDKIIQLLQEAKQSGAKINKTRIRAWLKDN